ncbi:hypothetical protein [Actinomadura madurae]|uniref:hypothetical protein n=1 Tax=Actinomadura madurae TaxID=1993 RepID=UPI0020D2382D|nr:hypothetical protein [Actinomadura madurae]MCQ0016942.1 hypothetical protein [Actinomadura madurae]
MRRQPALGRRLPGAVRRRDGSAAVAVRAVRPGAVPGLEGAGADAGEARMAGAAGPPPASRRWARPGRRRPRPRRG